MQNIYKQLDSEKNTHRHTQAQTRQRESEAENVSLVRGFSCHCLLPETVLCVLIKGAVLNPVAL